MGREGSFGQILICCVQRDFYLRIGQYQSLSTKWRKSQRQGWIDLAHGGQITPHIQTLLSEIFNR